MRLYKLSGVFSMKWSLTQMDVKASKKQKKKKNKKKNNLPGILIFSFINHRDKTSPREISKS